MSDIGEDSLPESFLKTRSGKQFESTSGPWVGNEITKGLGKGEAFVIAATLDSFGDVSLPRGEIGLSLSLKHLDSRRRFLAGRRLIRGVIAPWFGVKPDQVPLSLGSVGKPYLACPAYAVGVESGNPTPHLGLAHSGEIVMAVFSGVECGIDVERQRPLDALGLAERFFSREESLFLATLDKGALEEIFFRFWTMREAAIKADGRGMGALLSSTRIPLESQSDHQSGLEGLSDRCIAVSIGETIWQTHPWRMRGGYHASVAFAEMPRAIHWHDLR
jgi:4'-phosphopantetheinyl transferase